MDINLKSILLRISIIIATLFFIEISAIYYVKYSHIDEAKIIASELNAILDEVFIESLVVSESMKLIIQMSTDNSIEIDKFNLAGKLLIDNNQYIDGVQLLPQGVTMFVFPYVEHKLAIGHNIFNDNQRKFGAIDALISDHPVIIGPVKLIQNGKDAFIIRRRIDNNHNDFWGLSVAIIYLKTIQSIVVTYFELNKIDNYELRGYNPDYEYITDDAVIYKGEVNQSSSNTIDLMLFNNPWKVVISFNDNMLLVRSLFCASYLTIIVLLIYFSSLYKKHTYLIKDRNNLSIEACTDYLTQIPNRRGFDQYINSFGASDLNGSIAILDIDHFKLINDSYGHNTGDLILTNVVSLIKNLIRDGDFISRMGGEEFLILLPYTDINTAMFISDRIRGLLSEHTFQMESTIVKLTVSIGVAHFNSLAQIPTSLINADLSLYNAKNNGRNRVASDTSQVSSMN